MALTLTAKYHIASCILTVCFCNVLYFGPDPFSPVEPLADTHGRALKTPSDRVSREKNIPVLQDKPVFSDLGGATFYMEERFGKWSTLKVDVNSDKHNYGFRSNTDLSILLPVRSNE